MKVFPGKLFGGKSLKLRHVAAGAMAFPSILLGSTASGHIGEQAVDTTIKCVYRQAGSSDSFLLRVPLLKDAYESAATALNYCNTAARDLQIHNAPKAADATITIPDGHFGNWPDSTAIPSDKLVRDEKHALGGVIVPESPSLAQRLANVWLLARQGKGANSGAVVEIKGNTTCRPGVVALGTDPRTGRANNAYGFVPNANRSTIEIKKDGWPETPGNLFDLASGQIQVVSPNGTVLSVMDGRKFSNYGQATNVETKLSSNEAAYNC